MVLGKRLNTVSELIIIYVLLWVVWMYVCNVCVCVCVCHWYQSLLKLDISRSSQCSTTGVTKPMVCAILSVGWCI